MFLRKLPAVLLILSLISITSIAQSKIDYTLNWQKVDSLQKKGLTKSALQEVMDIYAMAVKSNNNVQQIKAIIYRIKYNGRLPYNNPDNIYYRDTLIRQAKTPLKNILQSIQAELLWQYVRDQSWEIYHRTKLQKENDADITTWSSDKFYSKITALYNASLSDENVLKATKIDLYDSVLIKGENTRTLRPTLFDFLTYRALPYFSSGENYITKPAYQFVINDDKAFAPVNEFIHTSFKKDSSSLQYHALLLFQNILQFHLRDSSPAALLDADFIRLDFINQFAVIDNKETVYEDALKNIEAQYGSFSASTQATYLRAQFHYNKGSNYYALSSTKNQYELKIAKDLCEIAVQKFPSSEGGINCKILLTKIANVELAVRTERVNIPNQPFRMLIEYRNVPTIYLRVIKISKEEKDKIDTINSIDKFDYITNLKFVKSWSTNLPDLKDYQQHAVELKVDALPLGDYFIIASSDQNFSNDTGVIVNQITSVSNISFVNSKKDYYVLNRDNGLPLTHTKVQVWEINNDYKTNKHSQQKAEQYTADKNGHFTLKQLDDDRDISLEFANGDDHLFVDDINNNYTEDEDENENELEPTTFLFTDRSIYRPAQTIYFKGIVVNKRSDNIKATILKNFKSQVILKDANGIKIDSIDLVTNEYGSYHGSFKLPEGKLNGQFSLEDNSTDARESFSVEEYKRPTFTVDIHKPGIVYRLNDSIKITGTAVGFSGNNITGAGVKYTVIRKAKYPNWYVGNKSYNQTTIINGETITNDKGEFYCLFKASPDESIDKKSQPVFTYEISADVTDINGETRSSQTSVAIAYQTLQLNIIAIYKIPVDSFKNIIVNCTNLNGIEQKTTAVVTIQKVKVANKIFRSRYWQEPDQFVMSQEEYYSFFPYDVYKHEDQVKNSPLGEKVDERTDSTNTIINIKTVFQPGWYKVIAVAKDKYGEEIKDEKFIQLIPAAQQTADPIHCNIDNVTAEPNEKLHYSIFTGFDDIWVINTLTSINKKPTVFYHQVKNNNSFNKEIKVKESDRGGIEMNNVFVKHNRIYTNDLYFNVPWTNKDLTIDYKTFRDKLLPGSQEKWTVKISGKKTDKVAAEMLVSMYDASLDQIKPHSWNRLTIRPRLPNATNWNNALFSASQSYDNNNYLQRIIPTYQKSYDMLLNPGMDDSYDFQRRRDVTGSIQSVIVNTVSVGYGFNKATPAAQMSIRGIASLTQTKPLYVIDGVIQESADNINPAIIENIKTLKYQDATAIYGASASGGVIIITTKNGKGQNIQSNFDNVTIRKDFNETAFFFPNLQTDKDGNVSFSFTMPEALTKWKLMTFAHTKELADGYLEKTLITQKTLMIQPNTPRFVREGDHIIFSAKIINLSDSLLTGNVQLELLDATTNNPLNISFKNDSSLQSFTVVAGQSIAVNFPITIPLNFNSALTCRIVAKAGNHSDGEETAIPILSNRMLVTESMPLNLRDTNKSNFKFEKLLNSTSSSTLTNHALTVEYTSNPAWYAVQSLPYLIEYPYECAEQTFNRYYANTLATYLTNSTPKIKAVFDTWRTLDTAALQSNLQKNEELKSALLQETPWVLDAKNENQQKQHIALLFDMAKMSTAKNKAVDKLKDMQSSNGGFVWFKGGQDDRYITQYIITGIGHLKKINALSPADYIQVKNIVDTAIAYLDNKINEDYISLIKNKTKLSDNNLSYTAIQYLYMRSFFSEYKISGVTEMAYTYYRTQAQQYWLSNNKYMQAMIALALYRTGDEKTAKEIIQSLKENSINDKELGMYWKDLSTGGYYWYQAPIESQAMMIEAFTDIDKNATTIDDLKTWLLKQKQTNNWKTTKATAEGCYALLLNGNNWLNTETQVTIKLGDTAVNSSDGSIESGTGYFKKTIQGKDVKPAMGNIVVTATPLNVNNTSSTTSWGSIYWQYFEDLNKITSAETPLKLSKQLFIQKNTDNGSELIPINDDNKLKVGDKITVRIILKVDRDMEYVQMKDMRAACMEPVTVLSGYQWQDGLGYYESTKDASTCFFFNQLPKGNYVFEYALFVNNAGTFSNGITTIQCMYAPEFNSHSEGLKINVAQ